MEKSKKQTILIVLLIGVIAVLLIFLYNRTGQADDDVPEFEREVNAKLGQLEGKSEEDVQAELDRVVEEGMFHISINTDPIFADGTSEGNLEIENVPGNRYLMRVEITLDDTGELVYSTKYIEPDYHIQTASLDVELAKGEYPATATFYAYDKESLTLMGNVSGKINLIVLN